MKKLSVFIALIAFFGLSLVNAQTREITGTVTSAEDGLGVIGANVIVKGTTVGVATDIDGNFSINVPEEYNVLTFDALGFAPQEITITGSVINVVLKSASISLDEVVVVAYGTAKKKSFTGSAASVGAEKLERKNVSEISKALSGEVAGVQVINTSGQPGTNAKIQIRGFGSVNAKSDPLYIVDGVPYDGDLSGIAPSDIASTTVLKDASATAIYGARGANGVIILTTKKGKKGHSSIEAEVKGGVNMRLLSLYDVVDSPERYVELSWESMRNGRADVYNDYFKWDAATFVQNWEDPAVLAKWNKWAADRVFDPSRKDGINSYYNMWNADNKMVIDPTTGKFYDGISRKYTPEKWEDHLFRTGYKKEATVKMSGGSDNTTYFTSIGYLNDEGYYIESDFSRLNTRLNVTHKVKEWLSGSANISYSYMNTNSPGQTSSMNNGFYFVNNMPSIYPVFMRDANGNKIWDNKIDAFAYDYGGSEANGGRAFNTGINPAGAIQLDQKKNVSHQITANTNLEASLTKELKLTSTFGMQSLTSNESRITNPFYGDSKGTGSVYKNNNIYLSYTWNQLLRWSHTFGEDHHVNAFIAHEVTGYKRNYMYGTKNVMVKPDLAEWNNAVKMGSMSSYVVDYSLESFFSQVKYDYSEKYFLYGTIRRDGSSRFPNGRWGTFGSVGAAWVISSEDFMEQYDFVKELKFKASYGVLGNQNIGNYPAYDNYTISNLDDYPAFAFHYKGNMNLTWESSNNFNTGLEFNLFNRIHTEIEYFRKTTSNLLFSKGVAPSLGYASIPVNDGKLLNTGLEFNILANLIKTSDVTLDLRVNGANIKNKMLNMPLEGEGSSEKPKIIDPQGAFAYAEGHSLYDFYIREWAGVDQMTGEGTWNRYFYMNDAGKQVDIASMEEFLAGSNGNKEIFVDKTFDYNKATKKFVGKSAIPTLNGAFGLDFSYKNISLSAQFVYSLGGYSLDYAYAALMSNNTVGKNNWHADIEGRWQKPGDVTDVPRLSNNRDKNVSSTSTRFLIKNDYIALNNVRINYDLPKSFLEKINFKSASINLSGDNLMMLSKRKGYIPATAESGESDNNAYTPLSTITVGLKVNF